MREIIVSKTFERQFERLTGEAQQAIIERLERLQANDENLDLKKLRPTHEGLWRLRCGKYRIIFEYLESETIHLLNVDSRDKIYRRF